MRKTIGTGLFVIVLIYGLASCDGANLVGLNEYFVTFDLEGGNIDDDTDSITIAVESNETIINLPYPQKEGYSFGGWYYQKNGVGDKFTSATRVINNTTVYANWIPELTEG